MFFSLHRILFLLSFTIISAAGYGQVAESQQALEDQYQNKIFLLRGFYSDSFLHFQATGVPMGTPVPGDWTVDGFVLISRTQIHEARLELEARRLFVVSDGRTFRFQAATPKKKKKAEILKIEVELAPGDTSGGVAAQFSKIFLTDRDSLAALVPDYWEACVSAALEPAGDQKYAYCHFCDGTHGCSGNDSSPSSANEFRPRRGIIGRNLSVSSLSPRKGHLCPQTDILPRTGIQ